MQGEDKLIDECGLKNNLLMCTLKIDGLMCAGWRLWGHESTLQTSSPLARSWTITWGWSADLRPAASFFICTCSFSPDLLCCRSQCSFICVIPEIPSNNVALRVSRTRRSGNQSGNADFVSISGFISRISLPFSVTVLLSILHEY